MRVIRHNDIYFKGQFAKAFEKLLRGEVVTLGDFTNGGWEATVKVRRFKDLLDESEVKYEDKGESLRTCHIIKKEW